MSDQSFTLAMEFLHNEQQARILDRRRFAAAMLDLGADPTVVENMLLGPTDTLEAFHRECLSQLAEIHEANR